VNIKEIADQAITLTGGLAIDYFKSRRYINEAMQMLAANYDTACNTDSTTITCTDTNSEYALPEDCIGVTKVLNDNVKFNCFTVYDNNITFDYKGTYAVRYIKNPALTDRKIYQKELYTDIPGINVLYHRALPFYVAAQILLQANPNDPRISKLLSDFNNATENVNMKLMREKRRGARIKAPIFR